MKDSNEGNERVKIIVSKGSGCILKKEKVEKNVQVAASERFRCKVSEKSLGPFLGFLKVGSFRRD